MVKLATAAPDGVNRSSGSATKLPMTVMTVSPATGVVLPIGPLRCGHSLRCLTIGRLQAGADFPRSAPTCGGRSLPAEQRREPGLVGCRAGGVGRHDVEAPRGPQGQELGGLPVV